MSEPVPQPPGLPIIGNLADISTENPVESMSHLAEKYGPIYSLNLLGRKQYVVSSVELLDELCDEKRFRKNVGPQLQALRTISGDGLFTAFQNEENWGAAHRTLVPAFGPMSIAGMFDEMHDIATQLVAKWARNGPNQKINVIDDFTRLALDSIALCACDTRFNSFYHDEQHIFLTTLARVLTEAQRKPRRTKLESMFNKAPQRQYEADCEVLKAIAKEAIDRRKANPSDKKDLVNALLYGRDPKTGKTLPEDNVMYNMLTFMIAGHETTGGMLSFATYYMLRNPETLRKAQQEVDSVVGKGSIRLEHMNKFPYIEAILRESMRLSPSAPYLTFAKNDDIPGPVILGGKYLVDPSPGASIIAVMPVCHRDPKAFGPDAAEFRPERMLGKNFENLPRNSWKPFGNGARACIGRPFAWQEGILALALILQNFDLRFADPSYKLQISQSLSIKPHGLEVCASLREGIDLVYLEKKMHAGSQEAEKKLPTVKAVNNDSGKPMTILFGSNAGTCEGLAQSLATSAAAKGYTAKVSSLDSAVSKLPTDQPVVIIASSYEGQPPDNARAFVDWLKSADPNSCKGVQFSVFGCGHHDWAATFLKVPKLIEQELTSKGATAIAKQGGTDVALNEIFDDFDAWQDQHLWTALASKSSSEEDVPVLDMEISTNTRASHLRHNVQDALVLENRLLTAPGVPEKWHMEIKLPTGLTYSSGDYMAILSLNNIPTISRILRRFKLPFDAAVTLKQGAHTTIPTGRPMAAMAILGSYVELSTPATKKNISVLERYAQDESTKAKIAEASKGVVSVLQILEAVPELEVPFSVYLAMLPPMRIRQYSISSSPLKDPSVATVTYAVVDNKQGHLGVATNYLKSLQPGSIVQVAIKQSPTAFHLPTDDSTPVIMACAGTGLAPFRGFVQERAIKLASNKAITLGPAALFVGCRDPEKDGLFLEEIAEWEKSGAVKVFYAFSRASEKSDGCKHVQDRIYKEREWALELFKKGAKGFLCGSGAVGKGVADVFARIALENGKVATHEEGLKWWESLRNERYAVDVFD